MEEENRSKHFIEEAIEKDLEAGKYESVHTRFPPEPNGYLHIGHAKAISIDFGMAKKFGGKVNLRMDDTNPVKEDVEYIEAIKKDIQWLGFEWDNLCFASDYFEQLYDWAVQLIKKDCAYVDELSAEDMREYRGTLTEPGKNSPYRDRPVEESLDLFERMKNGEFEDGAMVLRAKVDMASPNMNMRDPAMYRIKHFHHHRTGDKWCIYPTYDFTHGQSDSLEGVSHSLCSLEFEAHRPLYEWFIEKLDIFPSRQIEFSRLNLTHTVMSKRKLLELVETDRVSGWDDPRMPTLCGMRRKGYTAESILNFMEKVGVTKFNSISELSLLEQCLRQDLEEKALRRMAVLDPVKVIITNFPEDTTEWYDGPNHPKYEEQGTRKVPLTREIYIERDDFIENPPRKFFRLGIGREVRLRYACYVTCTDVVKDEEGNITEIHCEFDPESRGGSTPDKRRVKGTIHWVSATENKEIEVYNYGNLFSEENPDKVEEGKTWLDNLSESSLEMKVAYAEVSIVDAEIEKAVQFERKGYYAKDLSSTEEKIVFNRTVELKSSWAKMNKK